MSMLDPEHKGTMSLNNVRKYLPNETTSHPKTWKMTNTTVMFTNVVTGWSHGRVPNRP
jgi:hypothetical protein